MKPWLALGLILELLALTAAGPAQAEPDLTLSKLAPRPHGDPLASSGVASDFVDRGGVRYIKLKSDAGVVYIPSVDQFTPDELDSAFCANKIASSATRDVPFIKADRDLGKEIQPYLALVQQTIQVKCNGAVAAGPAPGAKGGDTPTVILDPELEIGVQDQKTNPDGTTTDRKIFTKPAAGPNLNLGTSF